MARQGQNIYKRKDGRYEGRYIVGYNKEGKPKFGYVYDKTFSGCEKKLNQAKLSTKGRNKSIKVYGEGTVKEYISFWLHYIISESVKASTFSNYEAMIDKWIVPYLGGQKMDQLDTESVQKFVRELSEKGLSAGTVRNIAAVFNNAMKNAFEFEYVYFNPCDDVKLPEKEQYEADLFTMEEQKKLEDIAMADKNGLPVLLAMYTGIRVGEICALKWSDVDIEKGIIRISRTIKRIHMDSEMKKTYIMEGPASRPSMRDLPLPEFIVNLLSQHKKKSKGEYVFTYKKHPLEPRILQNRFKAMLLKAGLRNLNFHALRHTFAVRCLEQSIDVKTISKMLGHGSTKITLNMYGRSQQAQNQKVIEPLEQASHDNPDRVY